MIFGQSWSTDGYSWSTDRLSLVNGPSILGQGGLGGQGSIGVREKVSMIGLCNSIYFYKKSIIP